MDSEYCDWVYRPGSNNTHFAFVPCKNQFNYLSKLTPCEPYKGVADYYNNCLCPCCGKTVRMQYVDI